MQLIHDALDCLTMHRAQIELARMSDCRRLAYNMWRDRGIWMRLLIWCVGQLSLATTAVAQAEPFEPPTVGAMAFHVAAAGSPSSGREARAAADRLYEAFAYALQHDSRVRWSESHEPPRATHEEVHSLRRLIVDHLVTGQVRAVNDGFVCDIRILSVETGASVSLTRSFKRGEEDRAAMHLSRLVVAAIVESPA